MGADNRLKNNARGVSTCLAGMVVRGNFILLYWYEVVASTKSILQYCEFLWIPVNYRILVDYLYLTILTSSRHASH